MKVDDFILIQQVIRRIASTPQEARDLVTALQSVNWDMPIVSVPEPPLRTVDWATYRPSPDKPYVIYAMVDPRDKSVRYIGFSQNLRLRYEAHRDEIWPGRIKDNWILELKALKLRPIMKIIEDGIEDEKQARIRENYWIEFYRNTDTPLTNLPSTGVASAEMLEKLARYGMDVSLFRDARRQYLKARFGDKALTMQ